MQISETRSVKRVNKARNINYEFSSRRRGSAKLVRQFLQRCAEKNITLNVDKWAFAQTSVTFAGLRPPEGYCVDPSIIQAIADFPTPANRTDLRSFIGMVNQLSSANATVATLLEPLHPLLRRRNEKNLTRPSRLPKLP